MKFRLHPITSPLDVIVLVPLVAIIEIAPLLTALYDIEEENTRFPYTEIAVAACVYVPLNPVKSRLLNTLAVVVVREYVPAVMAKFKA